MTDAPRKWWWDGFNQNFTDTELDWLRGFAERERSVLPYVLRYMVERGWVSEEVLPPAERAKPPFPQSPPAEFRATWNKAAGGDEIFGELAEQFQISNDEAAALDYGVMYWIWLHRAQYNSTTTEKDRAELRGLIGDWYSREPIRSYLEKSPNLGTIDPEFLRFIREILREKDRA